ncbi:MAG TPA: cytochrome c3 family protein [Nitrospiraceae bacterium]
MAGCAWDRSTVRATLILLLTGFMAASVGLLYSTGSSDSTEQDLQPVAFSHVQHAGELKVDCLYCHRSASTSPVSSIPSMQLCMGCHRNLANETTETRKLSAYWEQQKPIPWVRLQRLPDFVYFTHEMHLKTGLQCINCHGNVERMPYTPRAASYEMGWCLSCHQQRGASRDCWTCHK